VLCPSGLSAASTALLSCLSAGNEALIVDCVYGPVRHFAETILRRLGVTVTYFDPATPADAFARLMTEGTAAVYLEAPGSLTFEMQDVPGIAAVARARGATVLFDNTWATPYFFKPLAAGADLSIHAATKYLGGHADVSLGTVAANAAAWPRLKELHGSLGLTVAPDDIFLGLRGLRTLGVRLDRQMQSALRIAAWLKARPEVTRVLYPALPGDPGHALWKRDMRGASSLFAIQLGDWTEEQAKRFIDSLSILARPAPVRSAVPWRGGGPLVRLHIGLEDPDDLIGDLEAGFARIASG
jgi:cystathionine beta-lyase